MHLQSMKYGVPVQYGEENQNGPGVPEYAFSIVVAVGLFFLGRYIAQRGQK